MNTPLKLFTNPWITRRISPQVFIDLFVRLIPLLPYRYALPNPDRNDCFPDSLARVLGAPNDLPPAVLQAFADIEALAAPENQPLDDPALDIDPDCPEPCRLRNAIRQWLGRVAVPAASAAVVSTVNSSSPALRRLGEGGSSPSESVPVPVASAPALPTGNGSTGTSHPESSSLSFSSSSSPAKSDRIDPAPVAPTIAPTSNAPGADQSTLRRRAAPPSPPLEERAGQPSEVLQTKEGERRPCNPEPIASTAPQPATCNSQPATSPSVPSVSSCKNSDSETFARLAALSPSEYDRVRKKEADRLHLRVRTLDAEVARVRTQIEMEEQTRMIKLKTYEPWPEPVDGAAVLSEILVRFNIYAYMPPGAAVASTLWTGHVPAFEAFHLTPRLNLTSEFGGCGKTTVLDLIAVLLSRSLRFESLSPAVLFRVINLLTPVLLLDEVDTYLPNNDELRGLLNAGHKRDSHAYRCEGERYTIRAFKAFAPAVLAGIGDLPGTLRDRSIIIHMPPAPAGQLLTRFDPLHLEAETILARKLARWAKDNFAALAACDPPLPPTAYNRLADNWRPLFAVAQVAGGAWPALALDAFNHLTAASSHRAQTLTSKLLADIRSIFEQAKAERLFSSTLVDLLLACPNRPWPHANKGNTPITQLWLARRLLPLGISPQTMRIDTNRAKGYFLSDFAESFAALPNGHAPKQT